MPREPKRVILEPYRVPPKPYNPEVIKNRFWQNEPWDPYVPEGWLSDFVLALRGVETPTPFCLWTGIVTLSNIIKRDAWLQWVPKPLYPNFYVILVGPPKTGKSTGVLFGQDVIRKMGDYLPKGVMRAMKQVNVHSARITPEALTQTLTEQELPYTDADGETVGLYKTGSEAAFIISELSSFLGKQNYNDGLVGKLTDLYDCKDYDDDTTISRGHKVFRNIYVTIIGGTTRTSLEESIPEAAFGEGFMSRSILVFQDVRTRAYAEPRWVKGGPTDEELARRLAWVAQTVRGEYYLSAEAREAYEKWYMAFHQTLIRNQEQRHASLLDRFDIHLLKLSLLIRAQRYEPGNEITLEDFRFAQAIMDKTYDQAMKAVENVGSPFYTKIYNRVKLLVERNKKRTRRQILMACSPYGATADTIGKVLEHLFQEGKIGIILDGNERSIVSNAGRELYYWADYDLKGEAFKTASHKDKRSMAANPADEGG